MQHRSSRAKILSGTHPKWPILAIALISAIVGIKVIFFSQAALASTTLFSETFDTVKCGTDTWGIPFNGSCTPSGWIGDTGPAGGTLYSITSDHPTRVGTTKDPNSISNSQQRWFTDTTWNDPFIKLSADIKPKAYRNSNCCPTYSAFTFYVRRHFAQHDSSFYGVSPYSIEHKRIIEKKCVGSDILNGSSTLTPFQVGNDGTSGQPYKYYSLANSGVTTDPSFDTWHNMYVTAENNPSGKPAGTVRLKVFIDGIQTQTVDDTPGLTDCAPFTTGGAGWRSDDHWYELDNFKLESLSTDNSTCSAKQGDANNDNAVNILDISAILTTYGQTSTTNCADVNKDSNINILDISLVLSRYGT